MRKIYDRFGDVLYCIRDDGTITDKWDVDVVGHLRSDRITDKFDIDTLFRIRSDGTITDKWDVDVIGHIRSDGTITDKWDIDRHGSVDMPESTSSDSYTSSYSGGYSGGAPKHGSYFPDYGPWNLKKTICLLITMVMQVALLLALSTGTISVAINESLQSYIIVNVIMFANSLVSGILCKIAYYRVGSIISTLVNIILGIYIFVTAISSMEGIIITVLALLFFGFIEYWVVYGGYLLSSAFCKKYY